MTVEVNEDLAIIAEVQDDVLTVEEVVIEGVAEPVEAIDPELLESEETLIALAAAHNGWYKSNTGYWYYFVNGKWVTGWKKVSGYWYYFASNGIMQKGWLEIGESWYYLRTATNVPVSGPEGGMVVDWIKVGGYWYCLAGPAAGVSASAPDYGKMLKGIRSLGTYTYYFYDPKENVAGLSGYPEGAMVTSKSGIYIRDLKGNWSWMKIDADGHVSYR
ncbi:MAG: hypothetical protein HFJ72_03525 [Adlercreutzia sp.]|nr:hypothetical protein [Adlercreutzia sp.]